MSAIFGLNIAKIVNDAIKGAGGVQTGELIRDIAQTRSQKKLTGGTNPVSQTYSFQGFMETEGELRTGTDAVTSNAVVSILGASISVVPRVNDTVTIGGGTYKLLELLERDPAGALYKFRSSEK